MSSPEIVAELSILSLFMRADIVVQVIMMGLLVASLLCWTIIFDKSSLIKHTKHSMNKFENVFWSGISLEQIFKSPESKYNNPMSIMFVSAMREWEQNKKATIGMSVRIERVMNISLQKETDKMDARMAVLASIGSSAPFVGLLGTVWGIMNAFTAIAVAKQTSLAVVAPGIAEALFATALGLFAAIPATIAYNKLSSDIDRTYVRLEAFMGEFVSIISRQDEDNR